jgi:hypothetical protein
MTRHTRDGDPEFGSDSFLDIIANIVGILIILIVVAGVKVAQQSTKVAHERTVRTIEAAAIPIEEIIAEDDYNSVLKQANQLTAQTQVHLGEFAKLSDDLRTITAEQSQLDNESTRIRGIILAHEETRTEVDARLISIDGDTSRLEAKTQALHKQLTDAREERQLISASLQEVVLRQQNAEDELGETASHVATLQELILDEQQPAMPEPELMEHRLSPVARTTSEQELHFRMSGGRIAWVPLESLLDRMKAQVTSRADIVRRFGKYEGTCGPVGGFVMRYSVARAAPSPLDALNGIQRGFRIQVSRWTVAPSATFAAEPVVDALRPGSRFRQIVEGADVDATMTIWLYAEDFASFHTLREFAHKLDLRVAARPLPAGTEISGSPAGSRSSAQ